MLSIYAVEFENGLVKVGVTEAFVRRKNGLEGDYLQRVTRTYVYPRTSSRMRNAERAVVNHFGSATEHMGGVTFDALVQAVKLHAGLVTLTDVFLEESYYRKYPHLPRCLVKYT